MRYTQQARKSRVSAVVENYMRYRNYDDIEDVDYEHSGSSGGRGGMGRVRRDEVDGRQEVKTSDDFPVVHLSEHEYDHSQERYSSSQSRPHPSRDPRR